MLGTLLHTPFSTTARRWLQAVPTRRHFVRLPDLTHFRDLWSFLQETALDLWSNVQYVWEISWKHSWQDQCEQRRKRARSQPDWLWSYISQSKGDLRVYLENMQVWNLHFGFLNSLKETFLRYLRAFDTFYSFIVFSLGGFVDYPPNQMGITGKTMLSWESTAANYGIRWRSFSIFA